MGGAEPSKSVPINIISGRPLAQGKDMVTEIHIKGKMVDLSRKMVYNGMITNEQLTFGSRIQRWCDQRGSDRHGMSGKGIDFGVGLSAGVQSCNRIKPVLTTV